MIIINDLLTLPRLNKISVAAGENGLNRIVRTVSVMDAPDSHKWLKGGEFILTSTYLFGNDDKVMELTLMNLIEAGSACLGVKKDRFLSEIPKSVLTAANKHKFPILIIPYSFGWSEIISAFYELLYNTAEHAQSHISARQIDSLYNTGRVCASRLLQKMTEVFGVPMAIVRGDASIITDNGLYGVGQIKDTIAGFNAVNTGVITVLEDRFFEVFEIPFDYHGQKEYLAVLTQSRDFLTETHKIFDRLIEQNKSDNAIAHSKTEAYQNLAQKLLSDTVIDDDIHAAEQFLSDGENIYTCVIIISADDTPAAYGKLLYCVHKTYRVNGQGVACYMASNDAGTAAVIIEVKHTAKKSAKSKKETPGFFAEIEDAFSDTKDVYVAAGEFYKGINGIKSSYAEACKALEIGRVIWNDRRFFTYATLSVYALFSECDKAQLDFGAIDKLNAVGETFSWDAVSMVEAFIEYGGFKKAAEKLFMHENTLRYRIQKIHDATDLDLFDNFTACAILTQIKLKRLTDSIK